MAATGDKPAELERFIATEKALEKSGDILPTSRPVGSVFGPDLSVLDIPRGVTVLTPALMERFDILDLHHLARVGAGTQAANFFGIPGTPYLRGAKAGTYFNGMLRAYQRNEMPVSFGSLEALDVVKGPAPAHFGPTLEGGYVNFIPKSPYFDRSRGSSAVTVGSHELYRAQLDLGGPTMLGRAPAAYRVSLTGQRAGSYWNNVRNDYHSLYAAIKVRPRDGLTVFSGAEYYDFRTNENIGWNRVTQDLIDHGNYIIGEPQNVTDAAWGGKANRNLVEFPGAYVAQAANFRALIIPAATAEARIPAAQLALMEDRRAADGGYRYTQAYFDAGGQVLTAKIDGSQVVSDPRDFADSRDALWFLDVAATAPSGRTVTSKTLVEWLETTKHSSYGYAIDTHQLVAETKVLVEQEAMLPVPTKLTWGGSLRFSHGYTVQDFFAEPFNRRDISRSWVSANSNIPVGSDRGPDGRNLWSPSIGANCVSDLTQAAVFAYARSQWHERLVTYLSLRAEGARFRAAVPDEVDRASAAFRAANRKSGGKNYPMAALSPVWTVGPGMRLYVTVERGASLQPAQGGTLNSESNFARTSLREVGAKFSVLGDRLFGSLSAFEWSGSRFNDRDNKAERLSGRGVEFETTWAPHQRLNLIASVGAQRAHRGEPLGFRTRYASAQRIALEAGANDAGSSPVPALNPGLAYPGTPEVQTKLNLMAALTKEVSVDFGPIWSDSYYHNFEHTLVLPSSVVWNAGATWQSREYSIRLQVENVFSADYFLGADPTFSHNALVTKAPPVQGNLTFRRRF